MTDKPTIESSEAARLAALQALVRVVNSDATVDTVNMYADLFVQADAEHNAAWGAMLSPEPAPIRAHHEAGHAVVGKLLGFDFFQVTIKSIRDAGGHCLPIPTAQVTPEGRIVMAMAGGLAEAKYRHDPDVRGSDADDSALVKKLLASLPAGTRERCADTAITMVKENWQAITDLATELVEAQTISGDRLQEIMMASRDPSHKIGP